MLKRHEIQVLRRAGLPWADVARLAGVSVKSARRIAAEPLVAIVDDRAERKRRRIGRPSRAEPWRGFVEKILAEDASLLSVEILRRARLEGYDGGKSTLYALVAELRPRQVEPIVRFEGLPGEFAQHDFGQVDVTFLDGTKRRVRFFATRLKYSRWTEVTLVPDERVESLVRALVEQYAAIGGVPLLSVFDRPKTVALKWNRAGVVTEWNRTFAQVVLELGVGVELCWPRQPRQKGSVENLVGWVKGSFFKQRRFVDEEDLRTQLREWHDEVNLRRPSRATGVTPEARMNDERPRLRPLKVGPDELALRIPVHIGPTGMVLFETNEYSMPPGAMGLPGTLYLHRDRVRIVAGRFASLHPRLVGRDQKSILPEHRAQSLSVVSGRRARRYLAREHVLAVGKPAMDYLTELTHRRPRAWSRDVVRLHDLLQRHGEVALRGAFVRALDEGVIGAEYIAHFLGEEDAPSQLRFDALPAGGVQVAEGAAPAGEAQRSTWTPSRTARPWRRDGGVR